MHQGDSLRDLLNEDLINVQQRIIQGKVKQNEEIYTSEQPLQYSVVNCKRAVE